MDVLDKLKGAWKTQDYSEHKVSSNDIYKMLHQKSSSFVKWIFIISVAEFALVLAFSLFFDVEKYTDIYEKMGMISIIEFMTIVSYLIMIVFIILFYKNFKKINVDTDSKTLMKNIINTRKTVKTYIYFNIGFMALASIILFYNIFSSEENIAIYKVASDIPADFSTQTLIIAITIFVLLFIGLILLLYRIIYGILLRRLKKNYKELEQLDK